MTRADRIAVIRLSILLSLAYVALAVAANWLASRWTTPVGFGYRAPAGVYAIAAVLVLRDWLQQLAGLYVSVALIPVASAISWLAGHLAGWASLERIAVASAVAFCLSELLEAAVFSPLRRRSLTGGVAASGAAGIAVDSYVFLAIAFGSQAYLPGQMIGKAEGLAVGVALTALRRLVVPVPAAA